MTIEQNAVGQTVATTNSQTQISNQEKSEFYLTKRQKKDLREAIVKKVNEYFHHRQDKGGQIKTLSQIESDLTKLNPGDRDGEIRNLGVAVSYKNKLIEAFKVRRVELDRHNKNISRKN
jgi:hypothetical protein